MEINGSALLVVWLMFVLAVFAYLEGRSAGRKIMRDDVMELREFCVKRSQGAS